MNKVIKMMVLPIVASVSAVSFAGTPIQSSELPQAAHSFLSKYFPSEKVVKAEVEQGRRGSEYEVDLTSGAEVEFMADGNWKDVKAAKGQAVPADIVPKAIADYVKKNFEGLAIEEISRKRGGYEVELSNGTELKLTEDAKQLPARAKRGGQRQR